MQIHSQNAARTAEVNDYLSQLAGQWDRAVDFWPLVCLADMAPDPREWIQCQLKKMRSLIGSVQTHQGLAQELDGTQRDQLDWLSTACDNLGVVFAVFVHFRALATDEVDSVARAFARNHELALRTIQSFGDSLGIPVTYLQKRTEDHAAYVRGILEHLSGQFEEFRHGQHSAIVAPG